MTWPLIIWDSSLASQATRGELFAGSIGCHSSVGHLVGLDDRGRRGMVPVSRVAPDGARPRWR